MTKSRILISQGCIITMDEKLGDFEQGDILIEGGKIIEIAPSIKADGAEIVDATNTIVMPGFVDTHRHTWQTAMRGITADWSLMDYINGIRWRAAGTFRPHDMYAAQYAGALEALNAGITTLVDFSHNIITPDHATESIRGLRDAGIRAQWCYGFNEPLHENHILKDLDDRLRLAKDIAKVHFNSSDGLLTMGFAIDDPPYLTQSMRKQEFNLARELGGRITQHVNAMPRGGNEPAEIILLAEDNLLASDICFVHMAYTTEDEWKIIADAGCSISFTPETELQMGMGMPPLATLRRHGILPSLGADIVSNNSGDMFFPMRMLLQIERHMENKPGLDDGKPPFGVPVVVREALQWATINGAKAAGLDHLAGSLTPGKAADIIMIRTDDINLAGFNEKDPIATVVLQAHPGNVDTVMVAGNIVKRGGQLIADVARAVKDITEAQKYVADTVEKLGGFKGEPEKSRFLVS